MRNVGCDSEPTLLKDELATFNIDHQHDNVRELTSKIFGSLLFMLPLFKSKAS